MAAPVVVGATAIFADKVAYCATQHYTFRHAATSPLLAVSHPCDILRWALAALSVSGPQTCMKLHGGGELEGYARPITLNLDMQGKQVLQAVDG